MSAALLNAMRGARSAMEDRTDIAMKLRIERPHAQQLASEFPELAMLAGQLRFGAHPGA